MKIITFRERLPFPRSVAVGMASDRNVEAVRFAVPPIHPAQRAYVYLTIPTDDGVRHDVVELVDGQLVIDHELGAKHGTITGYAEAQDPDGAMIWHSDVFTLEVRALNDVTGEIEKEFPTALQQAMNQTAADREAANDSASAADQSAQAAADSARDASGSAGVSEAAARASASSAKDAAEIVGGIDGKIAAAVANKQDKLTAGEGITILDDGTISSSAAYDDTEIKERIQTVENDMYVSIDVDVGKYETSSALIAASTGKWSPTSAQSVFIPIPKDAKTVTVTARDDSNAVMALLRTDDTTIGEYPDYAEGGSRVTVPAGETQTFDIPVDCGFVYILKRFSATTYTPSVVSMHVSGYTALSESKQDKLIAGSGITISEDGKTISSTGGGSAYDDTAIKARIKSVEDEVRDPNTGLAALSSDIAALMGTSATPLTDEQKVAVQSAIGILSVEGVTY